LSGIEFVVEAGQVVTMLGPNGSGKTTLFRLLCTLMPVQEGEIRVAGFSASSDPMAIRRQIGIVFQSPSLDKKLTVDENIACQGALYGIRGDSLGRRRNELLDQLQLRERRGDLCEQLSGGLKRRVELAKGMLHRPKLLLLDEPSTGLDPAARLVFWEAIRALAGQGTAVLMTTHLLEEADKADRVLILNEGRVIADGTPWDLRASLGSGIVTITAQNLEAAEHVLIHQLGLLPQKIHRQLRLRSDSPSELVPKLIEALGERAQSITIGRPSLEDVFVARTGLEFAA
jgi:ABC-2 type transport system ATP-binding protein